MSLVQPIYEDRHMRMFRVGSTWVRMWKDGTNSVQVSKDGWAWKEADDAWSDFDPDA